VSMTVIARVTRSRSQSRRGLVRLEKLAKDPCPHTFGPLLGPVMRPIASKLQAPYRPSHTAFATGRSISVAAMTDASAYPGILWAKDMISTIIQRNIGTMMVTVISTAWTAATLMIETKGRQFGQSW